MNKILLTASLLSMSMLHLSLIAADNNRFNDLRRQEKILLRELNETYMRTMVPLIEEKAERLLQEGSELLKTHELSVDPSLKQRLEAHTSKLSSIKNDLQIREEFLNEAAYLALESSALEAHKRGWTKGTGHILISESQIANDLAINHHCLNIVVKVQQMKDDNKQLLRSVYEALTDISRFHGNLFEKPIHTVEDATLDCNVFPTPKKTIEEAVSTGIIRLKNVNKPLDYTFSV
jgi:hypothetical protein